MEVCIVAVARFELERDVGHDIHASKHPGHEPWARASPRSRWDGDRRRAADKPDDEHSLRERSVRPLRERSESPDGVVADDRVRGRAGVSQASETIACMHYEHGSAIRAVEDGLK